MIIISYVFVERHQSCAFEFIFEIPQFLWINLDQDLPSYDYYAEHDYDCVSKT